VTEQQLNRPEVLRPPVDQRGLRSPLRPGGRLAYDVGLCQEICMPRPKKQSEDARNFINVAVSKETRAALHLLKEAMGVSGQAEVIEKLVTIGAAIHLATR